MAFDKHQMHALIDDSLRTHGLHSSEAVELLKGTCAVESAFGTYFWQRVGRVRGPALGVFQMEPATFDWLVKSFRTSFPARLGNVYPSMLVWDLDLAILTARLRYKKDRKAIPKDGWPLSLGEYWKRVYNTHLGAGTPEKFVAAYNRYCV